MNHISIDILLCLCFVSFNLLFHHPYLYIHRRRRRRRDDHDTICFVSLAAHRKCSLGWERIAFRGFQRILYGTPNSSSVIFPSRYRCVHAAAAQAGTVSTRVAAGPMARRGDPPCIGLGGRNI